jgi:hypothetical protein
MNHSAMHKAFCMANGLALNGVGPIKAKIFYVNFSLPEAVCRQRFEAMLKANQGVNPSLENIRVISVAEYPDQLDEDFVEYLLAQKREHKADLIVLESVDF